MKLKLLISFFLIVFSCNCQDSLQTYPEGYPSKSLLRTANQEKKRKNKKHVAVNTNQKPTSNRISKIQTKDKIDSLISPFLYFFATLILLLIIKKLIIKSPSKKPYNYFKNEYIKSLGWSKSNEQDPKRKELLQQLDSLSDRQAYYRFEYLQSEAWKRKRYVVLKRDNWTCVNCGKPANQVHHKRYAKHNIGLEPIDWLVSVCDSCHDQLHKPKSLF